MDNFVENRVSSVCSRIFRVGRLQMTSDSQQNYLYKSICYLFSSGPVAMALIRTTLLVYCGVLALSVSAVRRPGEAASATQFGGCV